MKIVQATEADIDEALLLLDEFRTVCMRIVDPGSDEHSTTARELGRTLFLDVVTNERGRVFLAQQGKRCVGICTAYRIPQIRKGGSIIEIEEMFVVPSEQGTGIADALMDNVVSRAKEHHIRTIRLESHDALTRAHAFYGKYGFEEYGKAFQLQI